MMERETHVESQSPCFSTCLALLFANDLSHSPPVGGGGAAGSGGSARQAPRHQPRRNVVDVELVWRFLMLDALQQRRVARTIGTVPETIVEHLLEMEMITRLF